MDSLENVYVGIIGSEENRQAVISHLESYGNPKIIVAVQAETGYEGTTLNKLWEFAKNDDGYIFYAHTKGSSRGGIVNQLWEKFPEYFEMYREHHPNKYPFFAGNFWWTKSAHVKSLQAPKTDDKYSAEGWLGSNGLLRNIELFEGMPSLHLFQNVTF